ncbi:MAG: hypothetical protein LBG21_05040 [Campylobacteraceae bacterium]|nr:hypothetical protein [Campylobacteraceae bacterium]
MKLWIDFGNKIIYRLKEFYTILHLLIINLFYSRNSNENPNKLKSEPAKLIYNSRNSNKSLDSTYTNIT